MDLYAIAGKLLHQIFLPKEEAGCQTDEILLQPAYAPLRIVRGNPSSESVCMRFRIDTFSFTGYIFFPMVNPLTFSGCDFLRWSKEISLRIALVFKVKVDVTVSHTVKSREEKDLFVLSRAVDRQDDVKAMELYIPLNFLSQLVGAVLEDDGDAVEERLISFLCNGLALFPDISLLLDCLNSAQLQRLISRLRQNKMLTVYQISLLCIAFPQHAIKIKRALSKNTVKDVSEMMGRIRNDVTFSERDLAVGVYSVEEAVYRLLIAGGDVKYSSYLGELQNIFSEIHAWETFETKSFPEWIETIEREGLLYQVLIQIPDTVIALSFYGESALFERACGKIFTKRKLSDTRILQNEDPSLNDIMQARLKIVSVYRGMCVKRRNWGAESFEYIIRGLRDSLSFRRLLLETGWFTLSTALKNMRHDTAGVVLAVLPKPARYLIEDVLKGVLNPNILHDELQIQEARARCVRKALELYEKGAIRLVL